MKPKEGLGGDRWAGEGSLSEKTRPIVVLSMESEPRKGGGGFVVVRSDSSATCVFWL